MKYPKAIRTETNMCIQVKSKGKGLRKTNEIHCFIRPASKPILKKLGPHKYKA